MEVTEVDAQPDPRRGKPVRVDEWRRAVRDDTTLSPHAKLLGLTLATYMKGHSLKAWPALPTLAVAMGFAPESATSTVHRARRELIASGLLEIVSGGGRGRSTMYAGRMPGQVNPRPPAKVSDEKPSPASEGLERETFAERGVNLRQPATGTPPKGVKAAPTGAPPPLNATAGAPSAADATSPSAHESPSEDAPKKRSRAVISAALRCVGAPSKLLELAGVKRKPELLKLDDDQLRTAWNRWEDWWEDNMSTFSDFQQTAINDLLDAAQCVLGECGGEHTYCVDRPLPSEGEPEPEPERSNVRQLASARSA